MPETRTVKGFSEDQLPLGKGDFEGRETLKTALYLRIASYNPPVKSLVNQGFFYILVFYCFSLYKAIFHVRAPFGHHGHHARKEDTMKNVLLDKGIIHPSGEINKDKINLVAGAITQPFAEMVWVTTGGDMETINRLTDMLVTMNTPADRGKLFKIIKLLYGLMGLQFSTEAEPMDADPAVLDYFLFSFTADFGEIIKDYIAET